MPVKKQPIIQLDKTCKKYKEYGIEVKALNNISLKIFPGELVSIVGPSGCGKSTLLHCMGLLDRATSGTIYIDGKDTSKISGKEISLFRGEKLGFIFQNYNLIPRLTVLENVLLPGQIMEKEEKALKKRAESLLKDVGISHRAKHKGIHLSGGEAQRVAIARALINDPVLILADEPTGALDSESSGDIMDLLVEMNGIKNITTVFVSHDMEIAKYGKRTVVLKDGEIVGDTNGNIKDFNKIVKKLKGKNKKQGKVKKV